MTLYRLTVTPSNPSYSDAAVSAWELIDDEVLVPVEPELIVTDDWTPVDSLPEGVYAIVRYDRDAT